MATYYISGVWKNAAKAITHVLIHKVTTGTNFNVGIKATEAEAIGLIKANHTIHTIGWNYKDVAWIIEAPVSYITENRKEYLRSHRDGTVTDNLDNLINMSAMFG